MPELPEVETVRAYIHQYTAGKKIMHIDVRLARLIKNADADTFIHALTGQTIEAVKRRGKYLLLQCSGSHSLLVHLRMTGSLIYVPHWQENIKAAHIIFSLQEGTLVYRDFVPWAVCGWCRRRDRQAFKAMIRWGRMEIVRHVLLRIYARHWQVPNGI